MHAQVFRKWRNVATSVAERRETTYAMVGLSDSTVLAKKRRARAPTLNIVAGHIYRVRSHGIRTCLPACPLMLCVVSYVVRHPLVCSASQDGKRLWSVPLLMDLAEAEAEEEMQRQEEARIAALEEAAAMQVALDEHRKKVR